MNRLGEVLRIVNVAAFCLLGLACTGGAGGSTPACDGPPWPSGPWPPSGSSGCTSGRHRHPPGRLVPQDHPGGPRPLSLFLYRFATAFQGPKLAVAVAAHGATLLVATATLFLPYLPRPGAPEPGWWSAYRYGILTQWTILFSIIAARLWVAARHEASVVRRRMRTLALATAGLNGVVLLSGVSASPRRRPWSW